MIELKALVVGNWKLNLLKNQAFELVDALKLALGQSNPVEVVVAPVAPLLGLVVERLQDSQIRVAAQNVFHEPSGAYTGEWSVGHLKELDVRYSIIGHSERRQYFAESSESVAKKAKACLEGQITPIVCVGESLAERESGLAQSVIKAQLEPVLELVQAEQIVVAYEPIWAIGTGKNATPVEISEMHNFLRSITSSQTRLLYGGSVNAANARSIFEVSNVNGALVGGASLKADSFLSIVHGALNS